MTNDSTQPIVRITRTFRAPAEHVFDAWLDPSRLGRFLFATPGGRMVRVEVEPREGGRFLVMERRGEEDAAHYGTYLEIERPGRLVFSFATDPDEPPSRVTVQLRPHAAGCELTLTHELTPVWAGYEESASQGWTMILDALRPAVEEEPARG
ncbi:MAG TPA: SRPBCC domain-containing protein [Deinococcales bacterium]|nr:SRPBCC domain-containing protein [Deinococcales bacterium]